jgi:hypothetical protein
LWPVPVLVKVEGPGTPSAHAARPPIVFIIASFLQAVQKGATRFRSAGVRAPQMREFEA